MTTDDLVRELRAIYEALPDNADVSGRALHDLLHRLNPQPPVLTPAEQAWFAADYAQWSREEADFPIG